MIDMMGNMRNAMNFMSQYQEMRRDPRGFFSKQYNINIPENVDVNSSDAITQYILDSGIRTQQDYNNANQIRNNPMAQRMFGMN